MHPATIELMHEQVRTIYRAATGAELGAAAQSTAEQAPPDSEVERRFAELDELARRNRAIGERVPPFSFTPLVDLIDDGSDLRVEIAAPGVEAADIRVEPAERELRISGIRRGESFSNGRMYLHAEIPRGPFSRVIPLPCAVDPQAHVDVRSGVIVISLRKR
jgi:HSP20 family protein